MLFFIVFHFDIDKSEHMYYSYKRTYVLKMWESEHCTATVKFVLD